MRPVIFDLTKKKKTKTHGRKLIRRFAKGKAFFLFNNAVLSFIYAERLLLLIIIIIRSLESFRPNFYLRVIKQFVETLIWNFDK